MDNTMNKADSPKKANLSDINSDAPRVKDGAERNASNWNRLGKDRGNWFHGFVRAPSNPIAALLPTEAFEAGGTQEDIHLFDVGSNRYGFYACSSDGTNRVIAYVVTPLSSYPAGWVKCAAPVITPGHVAGVDDVLISAPKLTEMPDGSFRLYAHAYNGSTECGVVYSTTAALFPKGWTYVGKALERGASGSWCSADVRPEVIVPPWMAPDGLWHCIFAGNTVVSDAGFQGGHATSADGLSFVKDASPILTLGPAGAWDSHGVHPVGQWIKANGNFYTLFQGFDGSHWRIGVMETDDFVNFHKWPFPILEPGGAADVDGGTVENPGVVYDAAIGTIDFWYCANNPYGTSAYKICFARATGQVAP